MPYRHAHWFVGFVLLVIMAGFWASYFGADGPIPVAFHVHAVSAMTWLTLLIAQHLTIQRRTHALHSLMGRASFALFPFLILGFVMIINGAAQRYAAGGDPFTAMLGPSFGIGMAVAIAAYLTLYTLALRNRRKIRLHAGYMLATPLILFESPFSRVIDGFLPWMNIIGSEGPRGVLDTIVIADGLAIMFALGLYAMNRKHGAPWLVAAGFMAAQAALMWTAPDVPVIGTVFAAYAAIPQAVTMALGVVAGGAAAWFGWQGGRLPQKRRPATA